MRDFYKVINWLIGCWVERGTGQLSRVEFHCCLIERVFLVSATTLPTAGWLAHPPVPELAGVYRVSWKGTQVGSLQKHAPSQDLTAHGK